ncbi:MgtC/SapB family protein [Segnochrobactrum spirostomi]|uniref:Protein MgtC n=1 Tax=Segnochrobactrum spirostomi TaxID=2608987 RepID=A0A6A7XZQ1_9HYPH|nr:MgtC/SapB family protein [Segnochrobactrum spirostomi]MQT11597.1 MgtC/SapB family protein [Segnochrobactrum spirostomi]
MQFIETFELTSFLDTTISLTAAFALGTVIGAERQYRQRSAGLRTNVLVALGAAAFVDLAMRIAGADGAARVISYVVSGIGFLGAGVIMKEGMNVRGLNTAATLWASAAVGACAGADRVAEAALLTGFILGCNTFLRPLVNFIDRIPISGGETEASYEIHVTCELVAAAAVRKAVARILREAHYPAADTDLEARPDGLAALEISLVTTSVKDSDMDSLVTAIGRIGGVRDVVWESSATD